MPFGQRDKRRETSVPAARMTVSKVGYAVLLCEGLCACRVQADKM